MCFVLGPILRGNGCGDATISGFHCTPCKENVRSLYDSVIGYALNGVDHAGVTSGRFINAVVGSRPNNKKWRPVLKAMGFRCISKTPNAAHHHLPVTKDNQIEFWFLCSSSFSKYKKKKKQFPTLSDVLKVI